MKQLRDKAEQAILAGMLVGFAFGLLTGLLLGAHFYAAS